MDVEDEAAERYERLPWERLVPPPEVDRRRWVLVGGVAVVVAVVAFAAGAAGTPAPPPVPPEAPAVTASEPPTTVAPDPTLPSVGPPPVLPSEADLRASTLDPPSLGVVTSSVSRYVAGILESPWTFVDRVVVHPGGSGEYVAVASWFEVVDGRHRRAPDVALRVVARPDGEGVVVERVVPTVVPPVRDAGVQGERAGAPDPVVDALLAALAPWEGAEVLRVGEDAGGWWAEVAYRLPGGAAVTVVVRPDLPIGLGAGG